MDDLETPKPKRRRRSNGRWPNGRLADRHRDEIIARVAQGEFISSIARSLGLVGPTISKTLAYDQEYIQARQIGAANRLEHAYTQLSECAQGVIESIPEDDSGQPVQGPTQRIVCLDGTLARARAELWRAAAWFAEREFPQRFGVRQSIETKHEITIKEVPLLETARRLAFLLEAGKREQLKLIKSST